MIPDTLTAEQLETYSPGWECSCHAQCEGECACDANWTPKEVYELRNMVQDLEEANRHLHLVLVEKEAKIAAQQKEIAAQQKENNLLAAQTADVLSRFPAAPTNRLELEKLCIEQAEYIDAVGGAVAMLPWNKKQREEFWDDVHSYAEDLAKERHATAAGKYKVEEYTTQYGLDA